LPDKVTENILAYSRGIHIGSEPSFITMDAILRSINKYFSEDCSPRELAQLTNFTITKFHYLTCAEVEYAFDLAVEGVLPMEYKPKSLTFQFLQNVLSAYANVSYPVKLKPKEESVDDAFTPSPDEGYYNSLVCVMEGRKSPKFQEKFPDSPAPKGNEIPLVWDWNAVYRHLMTLRLCNVAETIEEEKESVMMWLRVTYPGCTFQRDIFPVNQQNKSGAKREFLFYT
jgi:hypothetical protein